MCPLIRNSTVAMIMLCCSIFVTSLFGGNLSERLSESVRGDFLPLNQEGDICLLIPQDNNDTEYARRFRGSVTRLYIEVREGSVLLRHVAGNYHDVLTVVLSGSSTQLREITSYHISSYLIEGLDHFFNQSILLDRRYFLASNGTPSVVYRSLRRNSFPHIISGDYVEFRRIFHETYDGNFLNAFLLSTNFFCVRGTEIEQAINQYQLRQIIHSDILRIQIFRLGQEQPVISQSRNLAIEEQRSIENSLMENRQQHSITSDNNGSSEGGYTASPDFISEEDQIRLAVQNSLLTDP